MKTPQTLIVRTAALALLAGLGACAIQPPAPPPAPAPTPSPSPTPLAEVEVPYEPWMGPRPRPAPSLPVESAGISPPVGSDGRIVAQAQLDDDHPSALLAAHAGLLARRGRAPLAWSDALAEQAGSIAVQFKLTQGPYAYCARPYSENYTARGEAVHIAPPGVTTAGLRRENGAKARDIALQWAAENIGAFDRENHSVSQMGCARAVCPQSSEIWVCRFR